MHSIRGVYVARTPAVDIIMASYHETDLLQLRLHLAQREGLEVINTPDWIPEISVEQDATGHVPVHVGITILIRSVSVTVKKPKPRLFSCH